MIKNDDNTILETAIGVINDEANAVLSLKESINSSFIEAVKLIKSRTGKVVLLGVGKSGLIGRKISATLASTGTPSIFVHPVESLHGDLGMISAHDTAILLSYSGETEETNKIIPILKDQGVPIIAITNKITSHLGKSANITIALNLKSEACPFNIVPTSSTTATLAVGDALAITLMKINGFDKSRFAKLHPGGNLGKLLNLKVRDIMHSGTDNPVISDKSYLEEALEVMSRTKTGAVSITDAGGKLTGYFTDGDLRRVLCSGKMTNGLKTPISSIMTKNPITVSPQTSAMDAAKIISEKHIDNLPVTDTDSYAPVGMIDEKDLLKEGLI